MTVVATAAPVRPTPLAMPARRPAPIAAKIAWSSTSAHAARDAAILAAADAEGKGSCDRYKIGHLVEEIGYGYLECVRRGCGFMEREYEG